MFYIYGKYGKQKTFKAMDINEGIQVGNLVRATRLTKEQADKFMAVEAPRNAPDWTFEVRPV